MDLPKVLAEVVNELPEGSEFTVDDFFEYVGISEEEKSDYAFASILRQAQKRGLINTE